MNKLQEIFKAWNIAFDPNQTQAELASKRIEICTSCDKKVTNLGVHRCSVCGCALKGKVFSPVIGACPEGKWDVVDTEYKIDKSKTTLDSVQDKSIFVQIASYRDPELIPTIEDLIKTSDRPEELTICIAWQHSLEDEWDDLTRYKEDKRFIILDIPSDKAKGACYARNLIQSQYNKQAYTLQIDSHTRFIKGWDTELIKMHLNLKNSGINKPLITSYLPSYNPDDDVNSRLQEVWKMTFNRFTPEGYIFTFPSAIENWQQLTDPVPARFFSAHFAFTTGEFCEVVPHDPFMYFHGEEPSLASRAFTHGYDLFHPHKILAWHFYTREGFVKHWDDDKEWSEKDAISHRRFRLLHRMEKGYIDEILDVNRFGFGEERTLEEYEKFCGFRYRDRKVQQYTLDFHNPPNPTIIDPKEYENSLLEKFKTCINLYKKNFQHTDYDYWVVSFENEDGSVIKRLDANKEEVNNLLNSTKGEYIHLWREYTGKTPFKVVVWPHSESKGYVERNEQKISI